jgi:hypothetical protein
MSFPNLFAEAIVRLFAQVTRTFASWYKLGQDENYPEITLYTDTKWVLSLSVLFCPY